MRTTRELAESIVGGNVTESILENIESGRKAALDVSQLLNIAMALRVPLSYLLAPMGRPASPLDIPNLSEAFDGMTSATFDAWLASAADGSYQPNSIEERNAVSELQALRSWTALRAEAERLQTMLGLERGSNLELDGPHLRSTEARLADCSREVTRLAEYLRSAGWDI